MPTDESLQAAGMMAGLAIPGPKLTLEALTPSGPTLNLLSIRPDILWGETFTKSRYRKALRLLPADEIWDTFLNNPDEPRSLGVAIERAWVNAGRDTRKKIVTGVRRGGSPRLLLCDHVAEWRVDPAPIEASTNEAMQLCLTRFHCAGSA